MPTANLIGEFRIMLASEVFLAKSLDRLLLPHLEFPRLVVVSHQHRVRRLQLRLALVQLLKHG